jgi:pimeloyl-ACP methyl ester carboxylesterase
VSEGRLTLRDGRTLAWRAYGPSDGRPLLWFQGTPGSRNSRHADESVYDRLRVQLIAFDRPGFGASSRLPGRGISSVADDAAELLDELALASVHVGGGSGGGAHVLALAAGHPERVLAATVVAGGSPFEEERDLDALIQLNRDAWHAAQEGWEALYAFSAPVREQLLADPLAGFRAAMDDAPASDKAVIDDPAWQRVYIESITEALRPGVEGWVDEQMALLPPWDFDPAAARCSLTWWHGEHDANAPIAAVRRLLDRMGGQVDLRVWKEAGHLEFHHQYDLILEELLAR